MSERPENFNGVDDESEATLVAPRFDANDARHAHPVVPLAEAQPPAAYTNTHASRTRVRRPVRRSWPPALVAVVLLAVAAVGGAVATKVLRRPNASPAAVQTSNETAPTQTAAAPTQPGPPSTAEAPRKVEPAQPGPRGVRSSREKDAASLAPAEAAQGADDDYEEADKDQRGRVRKKHRGHDEDEGAKELRKAIKRAKGKSPRLVDVLTNP